MDFIPDFGKYAFAVWTCYGVTFAVIAALTIRTCIQNETRKK